MDSPFPCQLVNKHWYYASISTVYKSITLKLKGKGFLDWEKLDSFCQVFKNIAIGPCVKEFTFHRFRDNLYLLGLIMKYCPNLEHISIGSSRKVCDYVASVQRYNKNAVLWENLKKVDTTMPYNHPGSYFYRFLYVFRNSLEYLHLPSIPSIFDNQQEEEEEAIEDSDMDSQSGSEVDNTHFQDSENSMSNLCKYIKDFKNLRSLHPSGYAINKFMNCVELLPSCANTLEELYFNFYPSNRPDIIDRPLSPAHDGDNGFITESVKKLIICNYKPDDVWLEFMYIKRTFPNLVDVDINHSSGRFWGPLTQEEISMMTNYILTLPKFRLAIGHTVNFQVVKQFFDTYMKHNTFRSVKIDLMTATLEGITTENYIDKAHPLVRIRFNSTSLQGRGEFSQQAQISFTNIIGYFGQHLHKLDIFDLNSVTVGTNVPLYHANMLDYILMICPHLQELSISGNMDIHCDELGEKHNALHTIKFKEINRFAISVESFLRMLSARAPNLKRVYLDLDRSDDGLELFLPDIRDLELEIAFRGHFKSKMDNTLKMEEEVIVIITTIQDDGSHRNRYYTCSASGFTSVPKINFLNLVHTSQFTPHISDIPSSSRGTKEALIAKIYILCSSFKSFKLLTGFDYILRE